MFDPSPQNAETDDQVPSRRREVRVSAQRGEIALTDRRNYSFKCHRYDIPAGSMPGTPAASSSSLSSSGQSQHVFAVNDICFHKAEGTFSTGGSDGSITFWDGVARTKLKRES